MKQVWPGQNPGLFYAKVKAKKEKTEILKNFGLFFGGEHGIRTHVTLLT